MYQAKRQVCGCYFLLLLQLIFKLDEFISGKQLFERSDALIESDLQFDDDIDVDESLFQTMEGLDLGPAEEFSDDDDDDEEEE